MKAVIVAVVVLAVFALTIGCLLILDAYQIKNETLRRIEQVDMSSIAKEYFTNRLDDSNVEYELNKRIKEAAGEQTEVQTYIKYRDINKGVISITVYLKYRQVSGTERVMVARKTFILERDEDFTYSYVRAISSENLTTISLDSVWQLPEYSSTLNSALSANAA